MPSSHAALEPLARHAKAEKIRRLLEPWLAGKHGLHALEIGTGSGAIAQFLATREPRVAAVTAVDIHDQRVARDGYRFQRYDGSRLPFGDGSFDLVISNHVIEHVGDREQQMGHLREVARMLRPSGVAYIASPSRWQLVEPHFRLLALSWIPRGWRDAYVRLARKGRRYDCDPLTHRELEALMKASGLHGRNRNAEALGVTLEVEQPAGAAAWLLRRVPSRVLQALYRFSPTMIYTSTLERTWQHGRH